MNKIILPNEIMLGEVSQLLAEGRQVIIMTKGVSMIPFIRGGSDSVVLEKRSSINRGDIVLAEIFDGRYVLHRVLGVNGEDVRLKGDGNLAGVERCRLSDIQGTVVGIQHASGKVSDPLSPEALKKWRQWHATPRLIRRIILGITRRYLYRKGYES